MGNSSSMYKSLIGKVDGVPIWPPKDIDILDVIAIDKRGEVDTLQSLKAHQFEDLDENVKELLTKLESEKKVKNGPTVQLTASGKNDASLGLKLLQSLSIKGNSSFHKKCTLSIPNQQVTEVNLNDGSNASEKLSDAIEKSNVKLHKLHKKWYNKKVFIVTKVCKAVKLKVSSSKGREHGGGVEAQGQGVDVSSNSTRDLEFETSGSLVTFAIKALRFDVSPDGILIKPESVQRDTTRSDADNILGECNEVDEEESSAVTGKKIALLIGNNEYSELTPLPGTQNDVDNFEGYLNNRGFKCHVKKNATFHDILTQMNETKQTLQKGDMLVFFYAGHGSTRRAESKGDSNDIYYEETICPVDTFRKGNGVNRDISRDILQAWMGALQKEGVQVFAIFDSCHSGGMIRDDEDIPEGTRETLPDIRERKDQNNENLYEGYDYDWLKAFKDNEEIDAALTNVAYLSACQKEETSKENDRGGKGGVFTKSLIKILGDSEGNKLSSLELMDEVTTSIKRVYRIRDQNPDVSGNIDKIAFCFKNIMRVSPHPYHVVEVAETKGESMKLKFMTAYMLPFLTKNSKYALYETTDAEMTSVVATIEIEACRSGNNVATTKLLSRSSVDFSQEDIIGKKFRAVEINHETGDEKHYVKVYVDNDTGNEILYYLEDALSDMKKTMFEKRKSFPVKVLPLMAFVIVVFKEDESDIVVKLSNDNVMSVMNREGQLVCPQVEVKTSLEVYLVASYIASYSNWNMWHNLSNPCTSISPENGLSMGENSLKIDIYGKDNISSDYNRLIRPRNVIAEEGYVYDLEWDENAKYGPATEPFKIKFSADFKQKCHIFLVELDLNYTVIQNPKYKRSLEGNLNNMVLTEKAIQLPIEGIMKEGDKWSRPYFELRVLVSVDDETLADGKLGVLSGGAASVFSAGINKADYENVTKGEEFEFSDSERAIVEVNENESCTWACIPIKFYVNELEKYSPSPI